MNNKILIFASNNKHKIIEVQAILGSDYKILKQSDYKIKPIPETGLSFKENAIIKAAGVFEATGITTIADDSGLVVDALNGEPGVYSARWAGPEKNFETAMNFLDTKLAGMPDRSAHFKTVLAYIDEKGAEHIFEGQVDGNLIWPPSGEKGFGYDPIFVPEGERRTFAEMERHEKQAM